MITVAHSSCRTCQTRTTPNAGFAGNDLFFQTDRGSKSQRKDTGKRVLSRAPFPRFVLVGYGVNQTLPEAIQLGLAGRVTARQVRLRQAKTRVRYTLRHHQPGPMVIDLENKLYRASWVVAHTYECSNSPMIPSP